MHCQSPCVQTYCGSDSCECDVEIDDSDSDYNLSVGGVHTKQILGNTLWGKSYVKYTYDNEQCIKKWFGILKGILSKAPILYF